MKAFGDDPHAGCPILSRGPSPADARLVAILVHGRGASAEDILSLTHELRAKDVAYLAPEAAGQTWYPYSFLAPIEQNEPWVSSGLRVLAGLVEQAGRHGVPTGRVVLMGFSQGACLSLEFAARNPQRYKAVVGLSGGVIGAPGATRPVSGSMDGTPVFLGCSDIDPHIPLARVHETTEIFRSLAASVDERIYPRMGHTVNRDELEALDRLLADA